MWKRYLADHLNCRIEIIQLRRTSVVFIYKKEKYEKQMLYRFFLPGPVGIDSL